MLRAVRESGGMALAVEEAEIAEAVRLLAEREGISVEPAGAVGVAATLKLLREGSPRGDKALVVSLTGHGLNDVQVGRTLVEPPIRAPARYEELRAALASHLPRLSET